MTLPAQGTGGATHYIPLGGDGYAAPIAAYSAALPLTGDASAGNAVINVVMDDRFASLVSYSTYTNLQVASADVDLQREISAVTTSAAIPILKENIVEVGNSAVVSTDTIASNWFPPPVLLPGGAQVCRVRWKSLNIDLDVMTARVFVYIFRLDVRQVLPMGPLLFARGSS